ncbi:MAG: hypothetical protein CEE42_11665 [Promethearchaeota archaeon Loki_b31]|nr:MAG: hypothetical protein CEE42_11665 [Candidatus Lokiarchaeota archaeon Loki_b31]
MVSIKEEIKKDIISRFEQEIEKFYLGEPHKSVSQIHQEFKEHFSDKTIQNIGKTYFPEDYKIMYSKPKVSQEVYKDIKVRIANEIESFYSGCSATPLEHIYKEFKSVINSVDTIYYIGKKEFPDEYNDIWARLPLPDEVMREIINSLKKEISNYKNGIKPKSLSRIHNDFQERVKSISVIAKIAKEKFPKYYGKIWTKVKITPEIKNKAINRIEEEIDVYKNNREPMSIRDIWKEGFQLYMSEGQLGEIGRNAYPEDYKLIWGAYRLPFEVKEKLIETINNEISKYDLGKTPDSLREIQRKFDKWVKSKDHIISIAKNVNPEKYDEIWSIPRIPEHIKIQVTEVIRNEIDKYNKGIKPRTIKEIRENSFIQFIHAKDTISRIAKEAFPKEYLLIWKKKIPYETRLDIIKDIENFDDPNVRTMGQIAKKHGVSNGTVGRISVNEIDHACTNFSHDDRFPKDPYADLGTVVHNILKHLITIHFWSMDLKIYSEIIVNFNTGVSVDNFFLNVKSHDYLYRVLEHNRHLAREMRLDSDKIRNLNGFMFDYTSDVSEKNIKAKAMKYQKKHKLFFIVGTRWPRKYKKRTIDTNYKNIRIIKHDLFAELIRIHGDLLKTFEYIIELNYVFDLNALKEFFIDIKKDLLNILGRYLFVNEDLKRDLKKIGIDHADFF